MHRRRFLGRIAVTVGSGLVTTLLPASLLHAASTSNLLPANAAMPRCPDNCGDWTLDDMCNACPGYTYDMKAARMWQPSRVAGVADVDRMWVA
jgi:hypothetical protein